MHKRFLLIVILLFTGLLPAAYPQGVVRGFVYDHDNGEPMLFVNVILKGTAMGAATDEHGYFSITKIPPGEYVITCISIGYDSIFEPVTVREKEMVTRKLFMKKNVVSLKQVEISADKEERKTQVQIGITKITPREIRQVPSIGGEPDLAQYLQVLPGVIFTGDQGGQLYIRGGTPVQNKVLLDGMIIYNPFHSIGMFSVFDADIIKTADIFTGGFGPQYGGRISSVMDITTRDGNKNRWGGKLSAGTFSSKILTEGPFKKSHDDEQSSGTFIFSGRTSYLNKSSRVFYRYIDEDALPYRFLDLYGKGVITGSNGSKLSLFGFRFDDRADYGLISDFRWRSFGAGSNFVLIPGNSPVLLDGTFAYSNYNISQQEADELPRESSINGFNMTLNFAYFLGKNEIRYGIEAHGYRTNFTYYNYVKRKLEQIENTSEFGAFFKYKRAGKKLVIDPGVRIHYFASLSEFSFEPRAGAKYNVSETIRLKAAVGLYAQNLLAAVSDRDVVNLFYGFLSGSDELPDEFKGKSVTSRLQHARHLLAGIEVDLPWRFDLNAEAYIKDFYQLENVNRDKIFDDTPANSQEPDLLKKDYIIESGIAKGVDFTLKYDYQRIYFWFVYSLASVNRDNGFSEYQPHFDRRHNINVVGSYTFGKKLDLEASARWNFGSPFPFTQTQGFYEYLNFQQGLNSNYTTANGILGILYGPLNEGRLPYYHRLDISVKKTFAISANSNLEITASITNVYDRKNVFYIDRIRGERVDQLPVLPSLNASLTF